MKMPDDIKKKKGKVKWFSPEKGFGFISSDDGVEFYAHHRDIISGGFKTLLKGQVVEFEVIDGERGKQAINIKIINAS